MLIYLNGTSSSGKSSVALELQKLIEKPIFYFSIDTLLYSLDPATLEAMQGKRPYPFPVDWDQIFKGYFQCVRSLVESGNSVIADCPVHSEKLSDLFHGNLGALENRLVVGLVCPLEILQQRELARGDRAVGLAERQFHQIHEFLHYDLKLDSHLLSAQQIAEKIYLKLSLLSAHGSIHG